MRAERVDVVVVSGDVYDRALPPVDAVALCNEALRPAARRRRARTVLISGNHDSARRLGFGADLIDAAGVHLRTDPAGPGSRSSIDDVAFYGIPYLEPELVRGPWELPERSHTAALYARHAARPRRRSERHPRSVVLAHAFVTGGEASDSERDISVGGVAHVPVTRVRRRRLRRARPPARPPARCRETVRYSGSPARLLLLRGRPGEGLLAGRPRRRP